MIDSMRAAKATKNLQVRVPPEIHEQIRQQSEAQGISMTEWVSRCLEDSLAGKARKPLRGA